MIETRVKDYYTRQVRQEWQRLIQDAYHRLEYETTLHFLEKYLPKHGRILDAGGGPGRYTIALAKQQYNMVLLDITRANLEFAKQQITRSKAQDKVEQIIEGTIVDLSRFAEYSFDAVLCLGGSLSHVLDRSKREKAIQELVRVTKKNAPIFISVMGRLSVLVVELTLFQEEFEKTFYKRMRNTGDYSGLSGFTACHFFLPEEFKDAIQSEGVKVLEMVGLEGVGSNHSKKVNELAKNTKRWRTWIETHYQTCTHPSVVGMSEHILLIGKKT
jgi:SAM-dependent methyltransferase